MIAYVVMKRSTLLPAPKLEHLDILTFEKSRSEMFAKYIQLHPMQELMHVSIIWLIAFALQPSTYTMKTRSGHILDRLAHNVGPQEEAPVRVPGR
jgi:hypothetical protein